MRRVREAPELFAAEHPTGRFPYNLCIAMRNPNCSQPNTDKGSVRPGTATRLAIKVVPGSSRDGVAGWLEDTLKVRVSAPPERGRANAAVEALLGEALGLPKGAVRVVAGAASPRKVVEIAGLEEAEVRRRLGAGPRPA